MSHFNNFPASNFMTDFEIVEIGNEQRRRDAAARIQEEAKDAARQQQEAEHGIIDDQIVMNMLLNLAFPYDIGRMAVPINPLSTTPDEENRPKQELIAIELEAAINTNNDNTNSSSNDSMYSVNSRTTSGSSFHGFSTVSDEGSNEMALCGEQQPLRVRNNDTNFLILINDLNKTRHGNKRTVVSSVSPGYGNILDNDYFLCHICHYSSNIITDWEYWTNEHPFIKNVGAMFHHLLQDHCEKPQGKKQLTGGAESYLSAIVEDIKTRMPAPLLQTKTSLPKASSTSCLETAWRSNQPELTKDSVNKYVFDDKFCKGHIKLVPIDGIEYWYDLANSMYCTCNFKIMNQNESIGQAGPTLILDQDLSVAPIPSFFNLTRRSIIQTHRTLLCSRIISMPAPAKFPHRAYKPSQPKTRSETRQEGRPSKQSQPGQPGQPNQQGKPSKPGK
jgi:hypothetical protein